MSHSTHINLWLRLPNHPWCVDQNDDAAVVWHKYEMNECTWVTVHMCYLLSINSGDDKREMPLFQVCILEFLLCEVTLLLMNPTMSSRDVYRHLKSLCCGRKQVNRLGTFRISYMVISGLLLLLCSVHNVCTYSTDQRPLQQLQCI